MYKKKQYILNIFPSFYFLELQPFNFEYEF